MKNIFKRYELKYILTKKQYLDLIKTSKDYMILDNHGMQLVNNVYFDTPDFKIIRKSLEKPIYKEKLRVRCYGKNPKTLYVELKKKYDGIVYKRRIEEDYNKVYDYLIDKKKFKKEIKEENGSGIKENQIIKEIDYFMNFYEDLKPSVFLSYEREAFYGIEDNDFRMTFDHNIKMRDYEIFNFDIDEGKNVLKPDTVLLEVKTALGIPNWLLNFFNNNNIYKSSFSKYGNSYKKYIFSKEKLEEDAIEENETKQKVEELKKINQLKEISKMKLENKKIKLNNKEEGERKIC